MKKITLLICLPLFINILNSQTVSEFSVGYTSLEGIAINSNNEVYVSEHDSGKIYKLDSSGNKTLVATAGGYANDMVFDTNNNLYITEPFTNKISVIDNATGVMTQYKSTFSIGNSPYGIDIYNGLIYFSSETNAKVVKINSDLTTQDYATGFFTPEGIAFDSNGNLYVADRNDRKLFKISTTGVKTTIASNIRNIRGVAVSSNNDVYFTTYNTFPVENKIQKYDPLTGTISDFVTTMLDSPRSIEIDNLGNMYVTNIGNEKVIKISDQTLSLKEDGIQNFTIYPNPVSNELNVISPLQFNKISIYNSMGEKLIESNTSKLNLENISSGIYFLKIEGGSSKSVTRKIIKN